jgi:hypothetical protein
VPKRKKPKPRGKQSVPVEKRKAWTLPTVLSLVFSAVTLVGLLELWPRIDVEPQEQLSQAAPFSAPFRIKNEGYWPFWIRHVFCYIHELDIGGAGLSQGSMRFTGVQADLWSGQSETVICRVGNGVPVDKADIAIVVDYRPWFWPLTRRDYHRFVGAFGKDRWEWLAQPYAEIKPSIDKEVEDSLNALPESMGK